MEVYANISKMIYADTPVAEAYRKELFGDQTVRGAPEDYYDMNYVITYMQGDWTKWESLDIDAKARLIAYSSLKNMADIIGRHYELMDEKVKKRSNGKT